MRYTEITGFNFVYACRYKRSTYPHSSLESLMTLLRGWGHYKKQDWMLMAVLLTCFSLLRHLLSLSVPWQDTANN